MKRSRLGYGKEHPETAHDADICPRPDVAERLALRSVVAREEVDYALALRLAMPGRRETYPSRSDAEGDEGD